MSSFVAISSFFCTVQSNGKFVRRGYAQPRHPPGYTESRQTSGQLCNWCKEEMFSTEVVAHLSDLWNRRTEHQDEVFDYKRLGRDVLLASQDGCPCCSRLITCIYGHPHDGKDVLSMLDIDTVLSIEVTSGVTTTSQNGLWDVTVEWKDSSFDLCYRLNTTIVEDGFCIFPQLDDGIDMASEQCFRGIRSFMRQCNSQHEGVVNPSGQHQAVHRTIETLPSRLIDITPNAMKVVSYDSSKWSREYAALSYPWGADHDHVLMTSTLRRMIEVLDENSLPPTISDAILVVRELGIQYLWVDALCIIQDDNVDKEVEIAKMDHIYGNARLTICSASTTSVKDHFLITSKRLEEHLHRGFAEFSRLEIPVEGGQLILKPMLEYHVNEQSKTLDTRAWALQEHILSNHLLVYSEAGVELTCKHMFSSPPATCALAMSSRLMNATNTQCFSLAPLSIWHEILQAYTYRQMKVSGDKFIAISALARIISPEIGGKYVAGLWERYLLEDLTWQVVGKNISPVSDWIAPSWSWASTGGVFYRDANTTPFSGAHVADWSVTLCSDLNPFGAISDAHLVLVGVHRPLSTILDTARRLSLGSRWRCYFDEGDSREAIARRKDLRIELVALLQTTTNLEVEIRGLMLARFNQETFRRIGVFYDAPSEYFDGVTPKISISYRRSVKGEQTVIWGQWTWCALSVHQIALLRMDRESMRGHMRMCVSNSLWQPTKGMGARQADALYLNSIGTCYVGIKTHMRSLVDEIAYLFFDIRTEVSVINIAGYSAKQLRPTML